MLLINVLDTLHDMHHLVVPDDQLNQLLLGEWLQVLVINDPVEVACVPAGIDGHIIIIVIVYLDFLIHFTELVREPDLK